MTTPSNGPSRMTSAGAAMSAKPMPVMRCAIAPTSTERATGRSTGTSYSRVAGESAANRTLPLLGNVQPGEERVGSRRRSAPVEA